MTAMNSLVCIYTTVKLLGLKCYMLYIEVISVVLPGIAIVSIDNTVAAM